MAKNNNYNNGGVMAICLLVCAAIILIIIYFWQSRRYVKNVGVVSSQPMVIDQMHSNSEHHDPVSEENGPMPTMDEPGMNNSLEDNAGPISNNNDREAYVDSPGTVGTSNTSNGGIIGEGIQGNLSKNPAFKKQRKAGCFPKEQLNPEELLPQDNANVWAQVNPTGEGTLKNRNFLQAGHHVGVNTVGQTLRNANMQLRSEPPNPQVKVSPWLQTTIEPDVNRKPLEIGGCA